MEGQEVLALTLTGFPRLLIFGFTHFRWPRFPISIIESSGREGGSSGSHHKAAVEGDHCLQGGDSILCSVLSALKAGTSLLPRPATHVSPLTFPVSGRGTGTNPLLLREHCPAGCSTPGGHETCPISSSSPSSNGRGRAKHEECEPDSGWPPTWGSGTSPRS